MYNNRIYNFAKKNFKRITHRLGWDIIRYNVHTSEDVLLFTILDRYKIKSVLDVGANQGLYALGLIENGYQHKILSFEPIGSVFEKLQANCKKYPNWTAFNFGIGNEEGELNINVSENFVSSSILKVEEISINAKPQTRIVNQEKIKITTVDNFLSTKPELEGEILLKLDVQGYELEALRGAIHSLPNIKLVQAELSFVPIYKGSPVFRDVVDFLEEHDFEIYTIIPGFRDGSTGRLLQADGIFVKRGG